MLLPSHLAHLEQAHRRLDSSAVVLSSFEPDPDLGTSNRQQRVDHQGRLSNPPHHFDRAMEILPVVLARRKRPNHATATLQRQRRLAPYEIDNLVDLYATGINVRQLAAAFGINRDTALRHLQRRGVPSRATERRLTDELHAEATRRYLAGEPMATLCDDLGINPTTMRRELSKTGIQLRRPGRPSTLRDV